MKLSRSKSNAAPASEPQLELFRALPPVMAPRDAQDLMT